MYVVHAIFTICYPGTWYNRYTPGTWYLPVVRVMGYATTRYQVPGTVPVLEVRFLFAYQVLTEVLPVPVTSTGTAVDTQYTAMLTCKVCGAVSYSMVQYQSVIVL